MRINLLSDYPLRGATLENMARMLLRRNNDNNFIFGCRNFDSIDEIICKYRLDCSAIATIVDELRCNGVHSDLIEFCFEDMIDRKITRINFYDVKSRIIQSPFQYFEMCVSDYEFFERERVLGCGVFIVSLLLFENWCLDFAIYDFHKARIRVYDSAAKKTVLFKDGLKTEHQ